jgi:hypothetical protein
VKFFFLRAACTLFPTLLKKLRDDACPASLMARADSASVISVEVLIEKDQLLPIRIVLKLLRSSVNRAPTVLITCKDGAQSSGELLCNLPECQEAPRSRWALDLVVFTEIVMELLDSFDDQKVHRKPDRSAPVRIAPEQRSRGFPGFILEAMFGSLKVQNIRMITVMS